jgi:adenylate cyclase
MKWLTHWTTALITLAVLSLYGWQDPYVKQLLRLKSFDVVQQYDVPTVSQDIIFVEIDEKAIELNGQWPWNRNILADTIGKLRDAGAGVIVLPILFSENDRMGGDDLFISQLMDNGVIVAQVGTTQTNRNAVPRGVAKIGDPMPWLFEWPGMLGPIQDIGEVASGVGVINTAPEIDGVVRRLPLLVRVGNEIYPSIAIETIRVAVGDPSYQVKVGEGGIIAMRVPKYQTIQTDANARIWLRWNKQFPAISLADEESYKQVAGKTVIIGITAEGIGGVIATPNGEKYTHLLPATAIQTIINGDNIVRFDYATFVEYASSIILGLLLILIALKARYWLAGIVIIAIPTATVYGSYYYFVNHLQLWDWSWIVLVTTLVGFHAIFNRFTKEFFEKQAIKKQFAGYCSPTVVRMLQENPALIKEGMKREVSICFSDLRGFTPLGESFGDDVKGLTKLMNGYMDAITQPVLDADGMIIKYIGDASMHVHNAPNDDPEHPKSAVRTGLNMLKAVEKFNEKITAEGRPPIGMGAGINTGLGYLGEMGSTSRHSYDVLGDAVSTAARIESKCKEYGCLLLVGENTYDATKDDFFYLKIDELAVKGKTVGIRIYTVLDLLSNEVYDTARQRHDHMHIEYKAQRFDVAIKLCKELKDEFEGKMNAYYDMWIERCEYMKTQKLPKDWDGIFHASTK